MILFESLFCPLEKEDIHGSNLRSDTIYQTTTDPWKDVGIRSKTLET